jgi:hypothetical protein
VHKIIEQVFCILKKRFQILKLPMCVNDLGDVEHIIRSCCILHNMIMEDKGHHTRGLLQTDWVDRDPDASKARRELYDVSNGRVFCFNCVAHVTTDHSNFMLLGSQSDHPNFCPVDCQVVSTEARLMQASRMSASSSPSTCVWSPPPDTEAPIPRAGLSPPLCAGPSRVGSEFFLCVW